MNIIKFTRDEHGYFSYTTDSKDGDLAQLIEYLTSEKRPWCYFIDPSAKGDPYRPGNYYFTRRDDLYMYIAEDHYLDDDDPEQEFKPTVILLNTMLGISLAWKYMRTNKIPEFTLTLENKRYTFSGPTIETIVVDPDLGNLYTETVPRIIARRVNGVFEYDLCPDHNQDGEDIHYFVKLLAKHYPQDLFITLHEWPDRMANWQESDKKVKYDGLTIINEGDFVGIYPRRNSDGSYPGWLTITKLSLKKFLQAWDTRLQFCNSFTLIFLGSTLRFFEGEPLPIDASKNQEHKTLK